MNNSENGYVLTDSLTGVHSRASLHWQLQLLAEQANLFDQTFALLLLDLDHFKSINDAFGHSRGDQVLVDFVKRLKTLLRPSDFIFRYGGDEFVILLPNTSKAQATALAEQLLEAVRLRPFAGEPPVSLTLSAGLAFFPDDTSNLEELFEKADQRTYAAKRTGRGRLNTQDLINLAEWEILEPTRLLEREQAFEASLRFLDSLSVHPQGVLSVTGPAGSGITRFLSEFNNLAALRGYGVVTFQGNYALKNRHFGVMAQAFEYLLEVPGVGWNETNIMTALEQWVADKGWSGLLITVDNLPLVDRASLEFLQHLLLNHLFPSLAIAYGVTGSPVVPPGGEGVVSLAKLELTLLSPGSTRLWLRHSLQWEPPEELVSWFYAQTQGYPTRIRAGIESLIAQRVIYFNGKIWSVQPDFGNFRLAEYFNHLPTQSPHNLPGSLPLFIGRDVYLRQIQASFKTNRLITLVGSGGIGKTRLALQVGAELLPAFGGGVYFVALAGIETGSLVLSAIIEALRLPVAGQQSLNLQLYNYLQNKQILLILDNFEQLLGDIAVLIELLENAPQLKLLVTSRERLRLPTESSFEIKGLDFPRAGNDLDFEAYGAIKLYLYNWRNPYTDSSLTPDERQWLVRLCRLVEGLPLGIELAAAWARSVPLEQIVQELERDPSYSGKAEEESPEGQAETERVEKGQPNPDKLFRRATRHNGLRPALDWFWNRLSRNEQKVLLKLTVFRGGFKSEAALEVAQASPFFLEALVAKSFLNYSLQGRYEMHELLRQYAAHKLEQLPRELSLARHRHSRYFARLLQHKAEALSIGQHKELEEITIELENVRTAWHWALAEANAENISRSTVGLAWFYICKGFNKEGEQMLVAAIVCLRGVLAESGYDQRKVQFTLAHLLVKLAYFLKEKASFDQLSLAAEEAVGLARLTHQPKLEAEALMRWGGGLMWQGERDRARLLFEQAILLARKQRLRPLQAEILRSLGLLYDMNADYPKSVFYAQQAIALCRELNNKVGECAAVSNLGEAYLQQGEYTLAQKWLETALELAYGIHFLTIQANASESLGKLWTYVGDYATSKVYLEQALLLSRRAENTRLEAECLSSLGLLSHLRGENGAACTYNRQALKITAEQGNLQYEAYALTYLGHALSELNEREEASLVYQAALSIRRNLEQPGKATEPLAGLARLALTGNNLVRASQIVEEILAYLEKGHLNGVSEPLRVYLTCYEVLKAAQDERYRTVLDKSRQLLHMRAASIHDLAIRAMFLEKIAAHRRILEAG